MISAPIADPARRGTCPTLHAPMLTGDGLLARVRVLGRVLSPTQFMEIARLAERHGNGLVEVTARGNLQVRGLTPRSAPQFAEAVAALVAIESGLVVDVSPLAGLDPSEAMDPRGLAERIRVAAEPLVNRLGPKVSVVVDGNGQVSLAGIKADIRLTAQTPQTWLMTLGGAKPQAVDEAAAFSTTMAVLGALAAIGPDARATDLFPAPVTKPGKHTAPVAWPGEITLRTGHCGAIALPFGQIEADSLVGLATAMAAEGLDYLRLAPDHVLLVDGMSAALLQQADDLGFVTRADDPRRHISACSGSQGCASGLIAARQIALRLAEQGVTEQHLHVSGCSKGCAHPGPARVTLVGRTDGIGLVIDGRAGDTPQQLLDEAALLAGAVPFQDGR